MPEPWKEQISQETVHSSLTSVQARSQRRLKIIVFLHQSTSRRLDGAATEKQAAMATPAPYSSWPRLVVPRALRYL